MTESMASLEKVARLVEAALRDGDDVPISVTVRAVPLIRPFDPVTVNGREMVVSSVLIRPPTAVEVEEGYDPDGRVQEVTLIDAADRMERTLRRAT